MKYLFCAFLGVILSGAVGAQEFLSGTEDVPVLPSMIVESGEIEFDTPAGQIRIVSFFDEEHTASEIFEFYDQALLSLGWQKTEKGIFLRGRDTFRLNALKTKLPARVRLDLFLSGE